MRKDWHETRQSTCQPCSHKHLGNNEFRGNNSLFGGRCRKSGTIIYFGKVGPRLKLAF
jgi:hypothetical protein